MAKKKAVKKSSKKKAPAKKSKPRKNDHPAKLVVATAEKPKLGSPGHPPLVLPEQFKKSNNCFQCDGSGEICNSCGESAAVCQDDECGEGYHDCDGCGGSGLSQAAAAEQEKE